MLSSLRPALRAPLLGFGLGALAGGFEALALGATLRLSMGFFDGLLLGATAVLLDGLLGAVLAVIPGIWADLILRKRLTPARYAAAMTGTALLLGCWFLWPLGAHKQGQGLLPAALAFYLLPIGVAGVTWYNAHYWLRREDIGEERRLGWWFWSVVMGLSLALIAAGVAGTRSVGGRRAIATDPTVILVTIDTLRRDHLSIYGESPVQTPVFDALANRGIRYDNAVTPLPETGPAHSALMTGRHPARTGVLSNAHSLPTRFRTLAEELAHEGYATGAFLSSFALDSRTGLDQGFQIYDDDFNPWVRGLSHIRVAGLALRAIMRLLDPTDFPFLLERRAPQTIDRALSWLDQTRGRPALLWVHLFEPHAPYEPHGMPGFEANGTPEAPTVDHRYILSHEDEVDYTPALRQQLRSLYAEEVAYTDQQLGVLLDGVEVMDLGRPVLLVVTADHGEMLGEHGIDFNHHGIWEETIRVPLVIVPPDDKLMATLKEPVVRQQVRLMDVPATILTLLKLEPMAESEGAETIKFAQGLRHKDYATLLVGRRTASLSEGTLYGYRAARADGQGNIKFIWDPSNQRERVFDLSTDPHEERDIAESQPAALDALRTGVRAEVGALVKVPGPATDPSVTEALRALGYVE